jgi:hypothetical protein
MLVVTLPARARDSATTALVARTLRLALPAAPSAVLVPSLRRELEAAQTALEEHSRALARWCAIFVLKESSLWAVLLAVPTALQDTISPVSRPPLALPVPLVTLPLRRELWPVPPAVPDTTRLTQFSAPCARLDHTLPAADRLLAHSALLESTLLSPERTPALIALPVASATLAAPNVLLALPAPTPPRDLPRASSAPWEPCSLPRVLRSVSAAALAPTPRARA